MTDDELRHEGRIIDVEARTTASPEAAWSAWADPAELRRWFTDDAKGSAEVGGSITWIFEHFGFEIPYEVLASTPNERLVLKSPPPPGRAPGIMEITVRREGTNTILRLVNSGFLDGAEWDDEYEGVSSGWKNALALMVLYLEKYAGRAKRTALLVEPTSQSMTEVAELLQRCGAGVLARDARTRSDAGRALFDDDRGRHRDLRAGPHPNQQRGLPLMAGDRGCPRAEELRHAVRANGGSSHHELVGGRRSARERVRGPRAARRVALFGPLST